ncbi:hypothetical protein GCM10027569_47020 [Flindersiella endophytica]
MVMALGAVLALGGLVACSSDDPGDSTGGASSSPTKTATPTPTVDPNDYQADVATAIKPLATALAAIPAGKGLPGVDKQLTQTTSAASDAITALQAIRPPDNATTQHAALIESLNQLVTDLSGVQESVGDKELCAPSSVLSSLGGLESFSQLPAAVKGLGSAGITVQLSVPKTPKAQNRRLSNGTFVRPGNRSGRGRLEIDNGTESDTIITLAKGKSAAFTVYVRSGAKFTVKGVKDGSYTIYYSIGEDWDAGSKSFTRNCGFKKFDDIAVFKTVYGGGYVQTTVQQIGLQPTVGGNATTTDVDPSEIP